MLTQEYLKTKFTYDDLAGSLLKSNLKPLGCIRPDGYRITTLKGKNYYLHRLIWLYHTGYHAYHIDHIDGDKSNNKFTNLREVTEHENVANSKKSNRNSTGIKGVTLDKNSGLFIAQVYFKSQRFRKCFTTLQEASIWVQQIRVSVHKEFANHG